MVNCSLHRRGVTHDYFLDSLLITTTSRTTTATPITVQSHIRPPVHPPIHPLVWFIINSLSLFLFAVGVPADSMFEKLVSSRSAIVAHTSHGLPSSCLRRLAFLWE